MQAEKGAIVGLENYPSAIKTKTASLFLKKLPIDTSRRVLFVLDGKQEGLQKSVANIASVKCVYAAYLNPEDLLKARAIIFMVDAFKTAEAVFGKKEDSKKEKRAKMATEHSLKIQNAPVKSKRSPTAKKLEPASKKKAPSKKAS